MTAMRRSSKMAAAVLGLAALWGGARAEAAAGEQDVPGFIFHHVSDSNFYEFELPLWVPGPDQASALALPDIMIPVREGAACGPMFRGFRVLTEAQLQVAAHAHRPGWAEGCLDLSPTKNVIMLFIGSALLLLVFLGGTHRNKNELVPRGRLANFLELLVLFVRDELAVKNIGKEEGPRYTPYLLSVFFFILFMNLLGLVPWMATATGALGTTVTLATITFLVTQVASIRAAGLGGYLAHLTGGVHWSLWPIMIPVEILGLFTKPFALTVRLFANMLAGHVVLFFLISLIFLMGSVAWAGLAVPFAFAIYLLEIFVSFVQAYIFTMLSALFIGMGVAMGHHHDEHGAHAEGAHSHDHGAGHHLSGG
jgi:F-type H+-transporting ATPase subunit a